MWKHWFFSALDGGYVRVLTSHDGSILTPFFEVLRFEAKMANGLAEDEMRVLVTWDFLMTDPHRQNGWIPCVVSNTQHFYSQPPNGWVFWSDLTKHPRSNGKKMEFFGVFFCRILTHCIRYSMEHGLILMMLQLPRWSHTTLTMMRLLSLRCPYETATLLAFTKNISRWWRFFKQIFLFSPEHGRRFLSSLIFLRWVVQPKTRSFFKLLPFVANGVH